MPKIRIEVEETDLLDLFKLLEDAQQLFHQPLRYSNPENVKRFAENRYESIHRMYYSVIWNWLPEKTRRQIDAECKDGRD